MKRFTRESLEEPKQVAEETWQMLIHKEALDSGFKIVDEKKRNRGNPRIAHIAHLVDSLIISFKFT